MARRVSFVRDLEAGCGPLNFGGAWVSCFFLFFVFLFCSYLRGGAPAGCAFVTPHRDDPQEECWSSDHSRSSRYWARVGALSNCPIGFGVAAPSLTRWSRARQRNNRAVSFGPAHYHHPAACAAKSLLFSALFIIHSLSYHKLRVASAGCVASCPTVSEAR